MPRVRNDGAARRITVGGRTFLWGAEQTMTLTDAEWAAVPAEWKVPGQLTVVAPAPFPVIGSIGFDWIEIMGHSLPAGGGARVSPQGGYAHRTARALGIANIHDYAIGGAIACRPTAVATGDGGYPWILRQMTRPGSPNAIAAAAPYVPQSQLVLAQFGLNDMGALGAAKPLPFQTALRTILSRACAAAVFSASNGTVETQSPRWAFTGAWADLGLTDAMASNDGESLKYTTTIGDKATYTTPADCPAGRVVGIGLWLNATYGTLTYGIKINGVAKPDLVLNVPAMTDQSVANMHIVHTVRIGTGIAGDPYGTPLPGGVNTIEITYKANSTGSGALATDFGHIEADPLDGPLLAFPLMNRPANYSIWSGWAGGASMNDAAIDAWKDYQRAILAEFPGRVPTDPTDGKLGIDLDHVGLNRYTPATAPAGVEPDFIADGAHPTDQAHARWAEYVAGAMRSSTLVTDRIRLRPSVNPKPRAWKKVGAISGAGAFMAGWSNYGNVGLPDLQWRMDERRRVYVRGSIKAAAGAAGILADFTLPKPITLEPRSGNQFDGAAWSQRPMRLSGGAAAGGAAAGGNLQNAGTVVTATGNLLEIGFDYGAEM